MKLLISAGNTQAPVDQVRCVTNIFSGRTGARIATHAQERGHEVTLLTSHPETVAGSSLRDVRTYRTFHDLDTRMEECFASGGYDAVIHAAAVNDFLVAGVYSLPGETRFDDNTLSLVGKPHFRDIATGKVKSGHPEMWIRMIPAPKLIDRIRFGWGFRGALVKFKLEVGVTEAELLTVAEESRLHSLADLMVANTLEGMQDWAYLGAKEYERVERAVLPERLLTRLEQLV